VLEIAYHTDFRGNDQKNKILTQLKVNIILKRLVEKFGTNECQVHAVGYGETQPIIAASIIIAEKKELKKEYFHNLNRRTELKILHIN
jgi:outer membrane protein OmpA-like peptidoglycan-associated protein